MGWGSLVYSLCRRPVVLGICGTHCSAWVGVSRMCPIHFTSCLFAKEPLWGWKYPCWWDRDCLVWRGLGCYLLGSPGCERPEDAAVGEPYGKKPTPG